MSRLQALAGQLRSEIKRVKFFEELEKKLMELGPLEEVENRLRERANQVEHEFDKAQERLLKKLDEVRMAEARAHTVIEEAQAEGEKLVADAKKHAETLKKKANAAADAARLSTAKHQEAVETQLNQVRERVNGEINAKRDELSKLDAELNSKQKRLREVLDQIEEARDLAKRMFSESEQEAS